MKKYGLLFGVTGSVFFSLSLLSRAQDPAGVLKTPFTEPAKPVPATPAAAPKPSAAQSLFTEPKENSSQPFVPERMSDPYLVVLEKLKPNPNLVINRDMEIQQSVGPWVVLITYYQGLEAPQLARQMVNYLREEYKLPAYVFNYGTEEKKEEYDRVLKERQKNLEMQAKQREQLKGIDVAQVNRVRYFRIEEQVGVLVGGYRDESAARRALEDMRRLKPPDLSNSKVRSLLNTKFYERRDPKDPDIIEHAERVYVNPFRTAFVTRNPTVKVEPAPQEDALDLTVLRRLNADEPFSLLQCKKPFTLVIKQFAVPTMVQGQNEKPSVLELVGIFKGERVDAAARSAHSLAEFLRKGQWEAYVLHTKYVSIVSVGNFDSLDEPALRTMSNLLQTRLKLDPRVQLLPQPVPMVVPGVKTPDLEQKN